MRASAFSIDRAYYGFQVLTDDSKPFRYSISFTLKFHPASGGISAVRSLYIDFLHGYDVKSAETIDWTSVEEAALLLQPTKPIGITIRSLDVFSWFLDGIPNGKLLPKLYNSGRMFVGYENPLYDAYSSAIQGVSLHTVLEMPSTHTVDGQTIPLNRSQLTELALCKVHDRDGYLRVLLASKSQPLPESEAQASGASM